MAYISFYSFVFTDIKMYVKNCNVHSMPIRARKNSFCQSNKKQKAKVISLGGLPAPTTY